MNYLEKITEIYAFVSVDVGGEGVVGMEINVNNRPTFMPFVCADLERVRDLRPIARDMAKQTGQKIKLIKLSVREEIEEFLPNE